MATIKRTISSFSVYSGHDQGDRWQTNYLAYSNSFVIPNEDLISVSISVTFTGIDSSDNELSSAVSVVNNFLFIESSQVGSGNYYSGNSSSQVFSWIDNKGKTVCLEWLHRDMISKLEGLNGNVFNYIISGYVQFVTTSGQITKIYLGNNALPVCYLGANRIERIFLGTNLILNAGTKNSYRSDFSGTFNDKGRYTVSKNLGTNVDSGTIVIDTIATVSMYSYNPSNGLFTCILNGTAGSWISGFILYDKYW